MKIPVIINNRDLLTWTSNMLAKIKQLNSVGEIYIVDNGSTYQPLLAWYETKPCNIIRLNNLGQHAPWLCGLVAKLGTPYVVTDSDLDISNLPLDLFLDCFIVIKRIFFLFWKEHIIRITTNPLM